MATALEVRATGIPYAFAPCIAVNKHIRHFAKVASLFETLLDDYDTVKLDESFSFPFNDFHFPFVWLVVVQVCRDPRWGRCYESYSEDHKIVQAMTEIIPGLQGDVPANYTRGFPYVAGK